MCRLTDEKIQEDVALTSCRARNSVLLNPEAWETTCQELPERGYNGCTCLASLALTV